ncbi:MAG: hypothetical protein JNK76_16560 [Planctomycetales bacterium]|nr:hypothetical protein [Planctomycetales bacterium]MBN8625208.1 hypothetical protein [Planctomycetota bacterium]
MGWLVLGTLLGALLGELSIPWHQHGWESEAYYPYRIVCGALIGLAVGLLLDFIGQYNRRKRDERRKSQTFKTDIRRNFT